MHVHLVAADRPTLPRSPAAPTQGRFVEFDRVVITDERLDRARRIPAPTLVAPIRLRALLRAGLVDELSLVINPTIDGSSGAPTVFNSGDKDLGPAPIESMILTSHEVLDGGAVWLRYKLTSVAA